MAALVQGLHSLELGRLDERSKDDADAGAALLPHSTDNQIAQICRAPCVKRNEQAWKWYASIGAPKLFVAPLVGYSEPAFRLLCRSYGAHVASTPMIDAAGYAASERYRAEFAFTGGPNDRPLTTQLGGSDPAALAAAATLVAPYCDAVELNMGCPQRCAKKNMSGAFLMEDPSRAARCIMAMRRALDAHNAASNGPHVATIVKIRCFEDVPKTVALAQALEAAGAEMITVHGRTRHAGGGRRTAAQLANWAWIRAVKESVGIPCVSNGNIRHADDVRDCFAATGCDGVMSGVGALRRPQLVYAGVRGGRNKVAAQYCTHALTTHAAPRQVHSHLCGKLALTAPAAIKDIRESINSLDVSGPETDRSRATISSLRVAFLAQPDDDDEEDEDAAEGETPIADDGWTKVWRDKRL